MKNIISATAGFVLLMSTSTWAQAPTATNKPPDEVKQRVKIWTFGAMLGQVEGFCEDPGGKYDWRELPPYLVPCGLGEKPAARWLGGAMGANRLLKSKTVAEEDLVIVTGDNQVPTGSTSAEFWRELLASNPDVVALGPLDFARTMRAPNDSARRMRTLVRDNASIPFLVSNTAIRRIRENTNVVEFAHDGYGVHTDDDATVGWLDSIKFHHPAGAALTAKLEEFGFSEEPPTGSGTPVDLAEIKAGEDGADGSVSFPAGLRPDRYYRLTVFDGGAQKLGFVFRTDAALTPRTAHGGVQNRPAFAGLPVAAPTGGDLLVVALIDPDTHDNARSASWGWKEGDTSYELLFTDPVKTLKALRKRGSLPASAEKDKGGASSRAVGMNTDSRPPVIAVISALADDQTLALLDEVPEVRFTVLGPESALLARAASADEKSKPRYSGDLGFSTVIDSMNPASTKVAVRPEWFGETAFSVEASLTYERGMWIMQPPTVTFEVTPGAALVATPAGGVVEYSAEYKASEHAPAERLSLGSVPFYRDCAAGAPGRCANFKRIWSEPSELTAVVGDAVRRATLSDISIVPSSIVDPDYMVFVKRYLENGTAWISQYVLERLLYTSPRMVRAYVKGDTLIATLAKVVAADEQICISGIGGSCPTKIDKDHPERFEVNGRAISPHLVYRIAIPDALAESLDLDHDENQPAIDLVQTASDFIRDDRWDISAGEQPLGPLMEQRRNRHWQGYWAIPTFDIGVTRAALPDDDDPGVRKNLGIAFRGAEEHTTWIFDIESDLAPLDYQRWAVRFPATLKFNRREEVDEVTYEKDEFSIGGRVDWKLPFVRPYAGFFVDGNWRDRPSKLKATRALGELRDGFNGSETAAFETLYEIKPRQFRYKAIGLDAFEGLSTSLAGGTATLKRLGIRYGKGIERNVPKGISIGTTTELDGVPLLDLVLSAGEQGMLNQYFVANHETFSAADTITIDFQPIDQDRFQADAEARMDWKWGAREIGVDASWRHRWYDYPGPAFSPFLLAQETRYQVKASVGVVWRLKLVASYEKQLAEIEGSNVVTVEPARTRFTYDLLEMKVSLPLMFRIKRGPFVR